MHKLLTFGLVILLALIVLPKILASFQINPAPSVEGKKTEKYLGNSIDKLQQVQTQTKNKQVKNEVSTVIEDAQEADQNIDNSIKNMEGRPGYLKVIMGPDYKNAGQVRSEIVHLRNDIAKLERAKEGDEASGSGKITESVATLQSELTAIETKLAQNLQGFSLFGWLAKLLAGFNPIPLGSPTPSPEVSATPQATATASSMPTVAPTDLPTAMP